MLVRFEAIDDRTAAESIRGAMLFVLSEALGAPGPDAYWEHELVGASVYDRSGTLLGTLEGVIPRKEQDLWRLNTGSSTVLIPAAKAIVVEVDIANRRVVIEPPPGLL